MLHRTLVTLLIAAALLIALAGGLVLLAESEWAERRIEEHLSGRLQRSVVLEDIDLRFAWPPRVTLGAVRVDNPPWAQTAHLLDAQEVTLTAEFWPLLRGRVVLDQVALKKASVGLERDGARATWHIASETPIVIAGTFRDPTVRPKGAPLAARAAAAGLLAMVNPLLALVPLIEPGHRAGKQLRATPRRSEGRQLADVNDFVRRTLLVMAGGRARAHMKLAVPGAADAGSFYRQRRLR